MGYRGYALRASPSEFLLWETADIPQYGPQDNKISVDFEQMSQLGPK